MFLIKIHEKEIVHIKDAQNVFIYEMFDKSQHPAPENKFCFKKIFIQKFEFLPAVPGSIIWKISLNGDSLKVWIKIQIKQNTKNQFIVLLAQNQTLKFVKINFDE